MKPRTKIEHAMLALAEKLPPITEKQKQYAFVHCFKPRAIVKPRKHEVRCLCCGHTGVYDKVFIDSFLRENQYDCPYCGRTMQAERNSPDTIWRESKFFTVLTTFRGYQVARTWEVHRGIYTNDKFARYSVFEIFQIWITPEGKEVITGRQLHRAFNSTTWDFISPLNIRRHNAGGSGYYLFDDTYNIAGNFLYPDVRVTPLLKRNGWNRRLLKYQNAVAVTDIMRLLLKSNTAEMLVKTGQEDLLLHMARSGKSPDNFIHSIRIANRHGYIVKDAQMWIDMLEMAAALGKDTHNPKVVCPEDLRAAHDALLAPMRRHMEKIELEKAREKAQNYEKRYQKEKAPYFDICISDDKVNISVIRSVAEMAEEGKKMHHCVFANGYYKRDDSLILSAKDHEGNRLETVELSLKTFKVVQSRARFNGMSELHNEIVSLVNSHAALFRQRAKLKPQTSSQQS